MRSSINLCIAVVGVAGSPGAAMSADPISRHGHSASVVARVPPTVAVDARGNAQGRRNSPVVR